MNTVTTDWLALQTTAHEGFAQRISSITDWNAATPDTEWSVRDLVAHVIRGQQRVPFLLSGGTVAEARAAATPLRDDLVDEWRRYSAAAIALWEVTDLAIPVRLPSDVIPADEFLAEQVSDVVIHSWDLARAIGADEEFPAELVEAVWSVFEPQKATLEASGLFASVVPVSDDAPLRIRLLALTGRDARLSA